MDKSALISGREFRTGEVEIEGIGTVTVRGLSRHEFIQAGKIREDKGEEQQERYLLSRCMVSPEMNEDDVAAWQKASGPMEINAVAMKVNELSGIGKGADKSSVDEVRD